MMGALPVAPRVRSPLDNRPSRPLYPGDREGHSPAYTGQAQQLRFSIKQPITLTATLSIPVQSRTIGLLSTIVVRRTSRTTKYDYL
ncbi:hypothetical protein M408DRAFT_284377 [Serendipita vermifera MAFF 305830]|uniref:Uncharacterized protein n=1 Tax=Serendipita vermifera MAFF 305830 TaxID=933852 RepID=A0A0C2W7Q5_SERVB|nr:hypothetical protein M408DRAFT_284377 [Serendipita vermifera MAFF 305830]